MKWGEGMAKNKFGKFSPDQWRKNLDLLESIYGSQKKAAEKLGVNVSTYRAYKTGKRDPKVDKIQKANRLFGQNKKKLQTEEVKRRIPKRQKNVEKKRQAREGQRKKESIKIESTRAWVDRNFEEDFIKGTILDQMPEYVAYLKGNDDRVVFLDPSQVDEVKANRGKPPRIKSVEIVGLYTTDYLEEVPDDYTSSDIFIDKFPMLAGFTEEWDIDKTLNYIESKFYEESKQVGRRKFTPQKFIGYRLK